MAEHPRSNPHEAEIAREELERLLREEPQPRRMWTGDGDPRMALWTAICTARSEVERDGFMAELERWEEQRMADILGPEKYAEYRRKRDERAERRRWHDEERRAYPHHRDRLTADAVAWMATLRPGDRARSLHSLGYYDGSPLPSEILTVERRTPSGIVIMTDGSKWRPDGYKRGETGREGYRTFIVPLDDGQKE